MHGGQLCVQFTLSPPSPHSSLGSSFCQGYDSRKGLKWNRAKMYFYFREIHEKTGKKLFPGQTTYPFVSPPPLQGTCPSSGQPGFQRTLSSRDQTPSNSTQKQREVEEAMMVIHLFMIGRWSSEGLERVCKKGYSGQGITVLVVQQQGSLRPSDHSRATGKAGIGRSSYFQIITILCIIRHY